MKTRIWIISCLLSLTFAAACTGRARDAISSIASAAPTSIPSVSLPSVSVPSISVPSRSNEVATPTGAPTVAPTEVPTEIPTTPAPTQAPTTAPTEVPTTPAPTTAPTPVPSASPSEAPSATESPGAKGQASTGTTAVLLWVLGILVVVILAVVWFMRHRRPSATLQEAYAASAAVRDRLAREVAAPTSGTEMEGLIDEADRALRATQVKEIDQGAKTAVEQTLQALSDAREGLALRSATAGAAHADASNMEARLLRALAELDTALGRLRSAAGGSSASSLDG